MIKHNILIIACDPINLLQYLYLKCNNTELKKHFRFCFIIFGKRIDEGSDQVSDTNLYKVGCGTRPRASVTYFQFNKPRKCRAPSFDGTRVPGWVRLAGDNSENK